MSQGLTTVEAEQRLQKDGPNQVAKEKRHRLLQLLKEYWAPVPRMLEATILLEILIHNLSLNSSSASKSSSMAHGPRSFAANTWAFSIVETCGSILQL